MTTGRTLDTKLRSSGLHDVQEANHYFLTVPVSLPVVPASLPVAVVVGGTESVGHGEDFLPTHVVSDGLVGKDVVRAEVDCLPTLVVSDGLVGKKGDGAEVLVFGPEGRFAGLQGTGSSSLSSPTRYVLTQPTPHLQPGPLVISQPP